jgi:putative membrane protein
LLGLHGYLGVLCGRFARGRNTHGETFYRWLNELPALFLVAIVILVIVRPSL